MENRCVCCGEIIPEGYQVCDRCIHTEDAAIELSANVRKGMILLNIPKSCDQCPIRHPGLAQCQITGRSTSHTSAGKPMDQKKRPKWCPIKPVPRRKPLSGNVSDIKGIATEMEHIGWNACLDELEKGGIE